MPALKQLLGGNLRQLAMVIVLILEILYSSS